MAKFVFQFEALLKARRNTEEQRQRELGEIMRKRTDMLAELSMIQRTIRQSKGELSDALIGRVDMTRVGQFARYSASSSSRAMVVVSKLAQVERDVESARQRLLQSVKERKAIELLKKRRLEEFKQQAERVEADALDEMAVQRHARARLTEVQT